jgi:hypothetical protein
VPCRIDLGGVWIDGCIHNVSARGLMVSANRLPKAGAYVDIRRGTLVIIGRVAWAEGRRFGVRTQDVISATMLVNEPVLDSKPSARQSDDRRTTGRAKASLSAAQRLDRSRQLSSRLQFVILIAAGLGAALLAATQVYHILAQALGPITKALGGAD